MNHHQLIKEEGPLRRVVWKFTILKFPTIVLDGYSVEERKTKRHKWQPVEEWYRLSYNYQGHHHVARPEVPADIVAEALTFDPK